MLQPRLGHLHDLPLPTSCHTRRHPDRLPPSSTCQSNSAPHHCDLLGDQWWSCCLWSGNRHGLPANAAKLPDQGMMMLTLHLLHFVILTCWGQFCDSCEWLCNLYALLVDAAKLPDNTTVLLLLLVRFLSAAIQEQHVAPDFSVDFVALPCPSSHTACQLDQGMHSFQQVLCPTMRQKECRHQKECNKKNAAKRMQQKKMQQKECNNKRMRQKEYNKEYATTRMHASKCCRVPACMAPATS